MGEEFVAANNYGYAEQSSENVSNNETTHTEWKNGRNGSLSIQIVKFEKKIRPTRLRDEEKK